MLSLSPIKILFIVAIVALLLGPDKLPDVARRAGQLWRGVRNLQRRIEDEVRQAVPDLPSNAEIGHLARHPLGLLDRLAASQDDAPSLPEPVMTPHQEVPYVDTDVAPFDPSQN